MFTQLSFNFAPMLVSVAMNAISDIVIEYYLLIILVSVAMNAIKVIDI
jgi:hypothetical protein